MASQRTGLLHTQSREDEALYKVTRALGDISGTTDNCLGSQKDSKKTKTKRSSKRMPAPRSKGTKMHLAVVVLLCVTVSSEALNLSDLLERVSMMSDKLHSLSTSLTGDVSSHLHPMAKIMRPSLCHTSSLQTPNDKEQAVKVPDAELLSLARSLLLAWADPLAVLLTEAPNLVHPEKTVIYSKTKDLQDHSSSLGTGLEHLTYKMGPPSQGVVSLPFDGDLGNDKNTRLSNFYFLLSCFRRDSHKIDSFLKVLRCRAAKRPEMC